MTKGQSHLLSSFDSSYATAVLRTAFSTLQMMLHVILWSWFSWGLGGNHSWLKSCPTWKIHSGKMVKPCVLRLQHTLFNIFILSCSCSLPLPTTPTTPHWQSTIQKSHTENFEQLFPSQPLKIWEKYNIKDCHFYPQRLRNKENCKDLFLAKF